MSAVNAAGIVIREAEAADLAAIMQLFAEDEVGGHAESKRLAPDEVYRRAFDAITASPDNALFVAVIASEIIGTFQLTLIPGLVNHGRVRAKLESVHVRADFRSHGIGERMVRFAVAEAKRRGAGAMELTSNKKRINAHRFYERLGFARSHEGFKLVL